MKNPSPSGLSVTPDPIRTSFCKVEIPVTFNLSVMMFPVPIPVIVETPAANVTDRLSAKLTVAAVPTALPLS